MKRWILAFLTLILLIVASIYIFIPRKVIVSVATGISSSHDAAFRVISSDSSWASWWPGAVVTTGKFVLNGNNYSIENKMFQSIRLNLTGEIIVNENLDVIFLPVASDSLVLEWKTQLQSGSSPLDRLKTYWKAQQLEKDLKAVVNSFKKFVENTANVYGNKIEQTAVKDSIILVYSFSKPRYPSMEEVYSAINDLKAFAASKNARETNYPMLNVDSVAGKFHVRVGLPVDREPDVNGTEFIVKRMVLGLILVSQVQGGPGSVKHGIRQVEQYMADFKRRSPAIPFESLIMDRSKEPDTSKWKTKIYYPVF
jgi:hypothetical protein